MLVNRPNQNTMIGSVSHGVDSNESSFLNRVGPRGQNIAYVSSQSQADISLPTTASYINKESVILSSAKVPKKEGKLKKSGGKSVKVKPATVTGGASTTV